MRGMFVTFEGPEGSGKSTQARILAERLRAGGKKVLLTREPGGTPLAEEIRRLVRETSGDPPTVRSEVLLFLAARAQVVEREIIPALERGEWVVCDRFCDSTFAYQGYGRGVDLALLKQLNGFATGGLVPDVTFLLDVPPEVSAARIAARQAATATSSDRMESAGESFHRRLRDGFLELSKEAPARFAVIDATAGVDDVSKAVFTHLQALSSR